MQGEELTKVRERQCGVTISNRRNVGYNPPMTVLDEYRRKRQFDRTPEPPPATDAARGEGEGIFVVQKHAARQLHYDFRLAIGGVLKSWAVPKGPSLNPADKRLALQTEDHPMEYASFEGKIPQGSYGAGTVMVWDRGTFDVEGDLDAGRQLDRGEIKFNLKGDKLHGSFALVKMKRSNKGNEWLMIKHADAAADSSWNIEQHDGSAITGRTLEEIAAELPPKREPTPMRLEEAHGARKAAMPSRMQPMLATLIEHPFSDREWVFEIKWDGVRALAWLTDHDLTLRARAGSNITQTYPELASMAQHIVAKQAILDGEIVVLDDRGHSDFERLQGRIHVRVPSPKVMARAPVTYYVFDLLYCDGYDLRQTPLAERKELLRRILRPDAHIRFSDHQSEHGKELFELARHEGLEGIIGKRADSPYVGGRSGHWVKVKVTKTLDAVVGGWTAPRAGRTQFGSLLLGLYDGEKLRFIGHVGSGFGNEALQVIADNLRGREVAKCQFDAVPDTNEKAFWTRPELVVRVRFTGWTQERRLRHPVFLALREDASAEDCRWETEVTARQLPAIARAPTTTGLVLRETSQIEAELFGGKQDNVTIELDGKQLRLTNLNKVYFPEFGYTKRELLAYYYRVADHILPFLKDRPLVMRRYPDGINGQVFFQKDVRNSVPAWLETIAVPSEGKQEKIQYAVANDRASLLLLTGLGCIDHNPWSSRPDDLEHPDYFFFDLDPSEGTEFNVVTAVAKALHEKLAELGIRVFLKTSGATGFHLYVPVRRGYTYEQLRTFAEIVARLATTKIPHLVTNERIVAKRPSGRVLIDIQQNALGRPLAAPYSVRAFARAPVSAPVLPQELRSSLRPERFNLKTIFDRLEEKGDLWADFWKRRQRIEEALKALDMHNGRQTSG
jgi:bifunctional non-homologous end joining protein LigD